MEQAIPGELEKRRGLRQMKGVALAFLLGATAIFFAMTLWQAAGAPGWVGYIKAAAEAGMVGALADWFAVTALFRRPLGLPIPHTAIIPTKKDVLGDSLGDFVGANFLSEQVVRERLRRVGVASRLGGWLAEKENAERVTSELATVVRGAVTVLRDEDVQAVMEQAVVSRIIGTPWGPPLGKLLERVIGDGSHHKLVDLMCDQAYEWVKANHSQVLNVVSGRAPTWSPKFVDALVADKVYGEVLSFAWAVKTDVNHPMRLTLDKFLTEFAGDMQTDPRVMERAEQVKHQVLDHPDVQTLIGSAWSTAKKMLLDAAEDPSSELRTRVRAGLMTLGERLVSDETLRTKADTWVEGAAAYVVLNYRDEITTLITDTVQRWDAEETSRKIELQVGRDLQFIRINGTVVGALAGLLIYTVAQLIS
ncbi:possible membrane protein [Alloactinosynnema sp. L-07]|nr:possible membrane protein [Alloactinosynnema sp. L-07]